MKEKYENFIGIYDESVPVELCNRFVENYEEAKKNRTIIDLTKENESSHREISHQLMKKDEVAYITPLISTMCPIPPTKEYFNFLQECLKSYMEKYAIQYHGPIFNDIFKVHKVRQTEGYHVWHYEKSVYKHLDRLLAYMTYIEVPKEGGETEFLHQSLRVDPIVGRTLIWPAGFTHMHRGNPPLDGEKMYITGWFTVGRDILSDTESK